jgi:hypothetical protein
VPAAVQHPVGQDAALQTHWPAALHTWPLAQPPQVAPPVPHEELFCAEYASHVPPAVQQPFGQEAASQTHRPAALHAWPLAQPLQVAPPVPQDVLD